VSYFLFFVSVRVLVEYVINFHRHRRRRRRPHRNYNITYTTIISILSYYTTHQMYHTEADNSDTLYQKNEQSGFQKVHSSHQIQSYNSDYKSHYISPFVYTRSIHYKRSHPDFYKYGMFDFQNIAKHS